VRAIDDVTPRPTVWTTGIIIEKDLPTPTTVRLRMHVEDRPGFWEQNGYHDRGDPWLEQRYQGD